MGFSHGGYNFELAALSKKATRGKATSGPVLRDVIWTWTFWAFFLIFFLTAIFAAAVAVVDGVPRSPSMLPSPLSTVMLR